MRAAKSNNMRQILLVLTFYLASVSTTIGQVEVLTNASVVEMSKAGLGREIILQKIAVTPDKFDISTESLIELKKAGVADDVIALMIARSRASVAGMAGSSPTSLQNADPRIPVPTIGPREVLLNARTISFQKSSLNPSRQALEKELLKRADWQTMNLTIEQFKDNADLYVDIGFVPLSLITHRYVYRIYDRRSGAVIAAGETTSWGSLATNLARNISKSLIAVRGG
jgi:hypothetical protein